MTCNEVEFLVNDRRVEMAPGEVWHIDVRFPHEVHNAGIEPRVHLVLDLVGNVETDALLARAESLGTGMLTEYYFGQRHSKSGDR